MNTLPTPDQPDNYTGIHNRTRIRWVSLETSPHGYTGHLLPGATNTPPVGSGYCTRLNPLMLIDMAGVHYSVPQGGYSIVPRCGEILGRFFTDLTRLKYTGVPVSWCPDCLTMAAVEAEMIGQRAYPVKTLLGQLGKQQRQKRP